MVHLDKDLAVRMRGELEDVEFIKWVTDGYLASVGGVLTAETMGMLSEEQHALLCYRYVLDEVMEGGFIQLILNGYAPYVLEGPYPYVVKHDWGMKEFSKLLYAVKSEYHRHQEVLSRDMDDDEFMALYEQLEKLNELGDDFLDEHQEDVTPAVARMIVENIDKYV